MENEQFAAVFHQNETPGPCRVLLFVYIYLCLFSLLACNTAQKVSVNSLSDAPAGVTSHFLFPTSGSSAEAYLTRPAGPGPFPLVILLHGQSYGPFGGGAETVVREAEAFASDLCYAGLAVSMPGFGETAVPSGTDPKITLDVVLDAAALVEKLPWIDAKRLYLYGFSRGAFFTSLLANRMEIEGMVLHSGAYDLNRLYQQAPWFRPFLNPSGDSHPILRSILGEVPTWHAPTLVLHGEKDSLVSVEQAFLLRDSLEAAKKPYQLVLYPDSGHRLPSRDVRKKATGFLKELSGSACGAAAP